MSSYQQALGNGAPYSKLISGNPTKYLAVVVNNDVEPVKQAKVPVEPLSARSYNL
jgi:hypothetical protein